MIANFPSSSSIGVGEVCEERYEREREDYGSQKRAVSIGGDGQFSTAAISDGLTIAQFKSLDWSFVRGMRLDQPITVTLITVFSETLTATKRLTDS